eukprot:365296-Chlamydomonas_euryale.AAC.38
MLHNDHTRSDIQHLTPSIRGSQITEQSGHQPHRLPPLFLHGSGAPLLFIPHPMVMQYRMRGNASPSPSPGVDAPYQQMAHAVKEASMSVTAGKGTCMSALRARDTCRHSACRHSITMQLRHYIHTQRQKGQRRHLAKAEYEDCPDSYSPEMWARTQTAMQFSYVASKSQS